MDANTPFAGLRKRIKPKEKPKAKAAPPAGPETSEEPDADLFARTMAGTAPLSDPRGRATPAPADPAGLDQPFAALLEEDELKRKMQKKAKALPKTLAKPEAAAKPKAPAAPQAGSGAPDQPASPGADREEYLFFSAMQGVERLDGTSGRDLPAAPPPPPAAGPATPDRERLREMLRGEVEFELTYSEEFTQAQVKGLDPRTVQQLRSGHFSWEAHLDLHGLNAEQAQFRVLEFVRDQYNLGRRCVLLVTGRGLNSPGGSPVLREAARAWLTQDPLRRVVLAFATALPRDGGTGALYVLLRKFRKSLGKVVWDRIPPGQGVE